MIYNRKITDKAYAKINLFLDVTAKRKDGFHDIKSIMQSVSLYDEITVSITEKCSDFLTCNVGNIPTDKRNLVIKAADSFRDATGLNFGVNIHIEKRIPSSAGLAGGSSDAAATIRMLNILSESDADTEKMLSIASSVGSDVPFCYLGGTVLCEGKGEIMRRLPTCPELHCVIAIKGEGISTPWAYGALDALYGDFSSDKDGGRFDNLYCALKEGNINMIFPNIYNVFEDVVEKERPEIAKLKKIMLENGAKSALMSGSGPSVFGLFEDKSAALKAEKALIEYGASAHYCTT